MPSQHIVALAAIAVALAFAAPAGAASRFVDDGGNDNAGANTCLSAGTPCQTIAHAVLQAVSNDTIQIGPGAYSESVTTSGTESLAFVGPGTGPPPPGVPDPAVHATITSAGAAPALHLQGGGSIENLRLQGANGASFGPAVQLGTSMVLGTRTYSVTNVVAVGGVNGTNGGPALVVTDAVQPGVQIDATVVGGHFSSGGTTNSLEVVSLDGANVTGALASTNIVDTGAGVTNWSGLAIRDGAAGTLSASSVSGDVSSGVLVSEGDSQALVSRSTIRSTTFGINVASFSGGANNAVTVLDSLVVANPTGTTPAVAVTEFSGNATFTARGSTFVARGPDPEAGIRLQCNCTANAVTGNLTNSVVRVLDTDSAPTAPDLRVVTTAGSASLTASHSSYDSVTTIPGSGTATATPPGSGTNLLGDPLFVDPATGDYTLQAASQLIERGDAAVVVPGELDAAGAPRAQDVDCDGVAVPDIGAFERAGAPGPCPPPGPGGDTSGGGGGMGAADVTPPVLGPLSVTNSIFRPAAARAAQRPRPRGTRFRYALSEDAGVRIVIERRAPGRRVGRRCRPPTRRLRTRRPCVRFVRVGTLRTAGRAGANSLAFNGRIGRRALRPGRYRALATATDAAGNRSTERRVSFRSVRR